MIQVNCLGASQQVYYPNTNKTAVDKREKLSFFSKTQAITSHFDIQEKKYENEALKERVTLEPKSSVLPPQIVQKIAAPEDHIRDIKVEEPLSLDEKKREISLQVETAVRKGLKELENIFEEGSEPTFESLKLLMDKYVHAKLTNNLKNSLDATEDSAKLVISKGIGFIYFPTMINSGGTKEIYPALNLETGEYLYVSYFKGNKTDRRFLSSIVFNEIHKMTCINKTRGVLPLYAKLDMNFFDESDQFGQMIFQKRCRDGSLYDYLESNNNISLQYLKNVALDFLYGLSALHQNNLLHRDIATRNIFLDQDKALIGDFDYTDLKDSDMSLTGGYQFLAPEVFLHKSYPELHTFGYSVEAEVWAAGLALYEMFAKKPFIVDQIEQNGKDYKYCSYTEFDLMLPWDDIEKETKLSELLSKMLHVNPLRRISLKEAFQKLEEIPEEELILNLPESYVIKN